MSDDPIRVDLEHEDEIDWMTPSLSSAISDDGIVDFGKAFTGAAKRVVQYGGEDEVDDFSSENVAKAAAALEDTLSMDAGELQALSDEALNGRVEAQIRDTVVGLLQKDPREWDAQDLYNAREVTAFVDVVRAATNSPERARVLPWGYDPAMERDSTDDQ